MRDIHDSISAIMLAYVHFLRKLIMWTATVKCAAMRIYGLLPAITNLV